MISDLEHFYLNNKEPARACLLALKTIILKMDDNVSSCWKYRMPFFCFKGKMFCYLWTDKKTKEPYIGIVEGNRMSHPLLEQGKRSRMKILRINPEKDLPVELIELILNQALDFYRKGLIKI